MDPTYSPILYLLLGQATAVIMRELSFVFKEFFPLAMVAEEPFF